MRGKQWLEYWQSQVQLVSTMSTCITRQTGAIVVRDRHMIASGFNGNVPRGKHCTQGGCPRCTARAEGLTEAQRWENSERMRLGEPLIEPGTKLDLCTCVHAEVNAIAQCARFGQATAGATLYCTTRPCLDCIKLIAVAGIVEVVYDEPYPATYATPPTISMRTFTAYTGSAPA